MNEDFERRFETKMEFIVEQQAQFTTDIQQLQHIVTRLANTSLNRFERVDDIVAALIDSQLKADAHLERFEESVAEKMRELAEAQEHTDRRLNALIDIVRDEREGES